MQSIEKLEFAKQKLQAADVPFQIRITSYLRLCCLILDQDGSRYSKLLKALYNYDANWWQTCQISAYGGLQSTDPIVTDLLHSIEALHPVNMPPQELESQSQKLELQTIAA